VAIKLGPIKNSLFNAVKQNGLNFLGIRREKSNALNIVVVLFQIVIPSADYFFLQKTVFAIKVLKHLFVDFIADIALVHHNNILHTITAVERLVMIANLGN
jgi:hypothetical protein